MLPSVAKLAVKFPGGWNSLPFASHGLSLSCAELSTCFTKRKRAICRMIEGS